MAYFCVYILLLCFMTDAIHGLKCWHCTGDNCDIDPNDNEKAKEISCFSDDMTCQKVYFEMFDEAANVVYTSTVRSCANYCEKRNDFKNCTSAQRTRIGCTRKDCCRDSDFCNSSDGLKFSVISSCALVYLSLTWRNMMLK